MGLQDLEKYILYLKRDINHLIEKKQFQLQDAEIQQLSKTLDELINKYYSILRGE